ncbi:hypothetical protein SSABA_v1c03320 [Spiroplasma sabaudiense Ar-1343]|uniref:PPC domain-containing protein n=1 Tax=Spiroplasma sabaudiense Ar-1343 TaxID=1276257 RepID=W6A9E5_9MOLU|nr:DUF296 domain-containing protein [Spiroplasma sabaudiense]AHI53743.1 hypothetical protein SSABA_v1c03320 [Spiroplasma sabaudiense Ar-1343]
MEIKERSNRILLIMNSGENIKAILNDVVFQYGIIEATIYGFGYCKEIEWGTLEKEDPIFYKKNFLKKTAIISSFNGSITDRNIHVHMSGIGTNNFIFSGHFISAISGENFSVTLDILKTE